MTIRLNQETLLQGVEYLVAKDKHLNAIVSDIGPPPLWGREEGFPALIYTILEQQVSLASARATYNKLLNKVSPLTPDRFLKLSDSALRTLGFSRQKTRYCRIVARAIIDGELDLSMFSVMDDSRVKKKLMSLTGIGHWTADIYLLQSLGRPDIWPSGDLALAQAVKEVYGGKKRPSTEELEFLGLKWKPWRAVAARILWHYYLSDKDF